MSQESLKKAFEVIEELGGYFVFKNDEGEEYVLARRGDVQTEQNIQSEMQLSLGQAPLINTADEVLERINEELALYQIQQDEQELEHEHIEDDQESQAPPMRIRFEPLRGDLSPDLQD